MAPLSPEVAKSTARRLLKRARSSSHPVVRNSYRLARRTARDAMNRVTGRQVGWMATLRSARWVDELTFEVGGWAYERGYPFPADAPPRIAVWIESGTSRVDATVTPRPDTEANAEAFKAEFDYANTGFVARFDLSTLPQRPETEWVVKIKVGAGRRVTTGPFKYRYQGGSARHLFTRTTADDRQITPVWRRGLRLLSRQASVMATDVVLDGRSFAATLRTHGPVLSGASLVSGEAEVPLSCEPVGSPGEDRYRISGEVPEDYPEKGGRQVRSRVWGVRVVTAEGAGYPVRTDLDDTLPVTPADATLFASSNAGALRLNDAAAQVVVEDYAVEQEPRLGLRLRGRVFGDVGDAPVVHLIGPRQDLPGDTALGPDGSL